MSEEYVRSTNGIVSLFFLHALVVPPPAPLGILFHSDL